MCVQLLVYIIFKISIIFNFTKLVCCMPITSPQRKLLEVCRHIPSCSMQEEVSKDLRNSATGLHQISLNLVIQSCVADVDTQPFRLRTV